MEHGAVEVQRDGHLSMLRCFGGSSQREAIGAFLLKRQGKYEECTGIGRVFGKWNDGISAYLVCSHASEILRRKFSRAVFLLNRSIASGEHGKCRGFHQEPTDIFRTAGQLGTRQPAVCECVGQVILVSSGIWTAGNYDLNTSILRNEWGYTGMVMTDWWAKMNEREKLRARRILQLWYAPRMMSLW